MSGDDPVMLDLSVLLEVEERFMIMGAQVEVAPGCDELILFRRRDGDDLARGSDDGAAANELTSLFSARLGNTHDPRVVLIGSSLHDEVVVKI